MAQGLQVGYLCSETRATDRKKRESANPKILTCGWQEKKRDVFGLWMSAEEPADRFQYNLTCFTAPSLKQALETESAALCDYSADFLFITAFSEPHLGPLAAEQGNSPGFVNLSGYAGALTRDTCSCAVCAPHT